jgi:hypothetical protein
MRLLYKYPHKEYKFCRRVLLKIASEDPAFTMELGNIQQVTKPDLSSWLRWPLAPSTEFFGLYTELRNQFSPLSTRIAHRVRNSKLGEQYFPEKGKALHWNLREFRNPNILVLKSGNADNYQQTQKT